MQANTHACTHLSGHFNVSVFDWADELILGGFGILITNGIANVSVCVCEMRTKTFPLNVESRECFFFN